MSNIPLKPLDDRIVAIREESATKTSAGLYLPDNAKEKSQIAKVVAVGSNVKEIKDGDRIVVREYSTTEVKLDDKKYLIVKEEDVLAVVQ